MIQNITFFFGCVFLIIVYQVLGYRFTWWLAGVLDWMCSKVWSDW